jgi:hypothetical protein
MKATVIINDKAKEIDITEKQAVELGLIEERKTGWEKNIEGYFYTIDKQLCVEKCEGSFIFYNGDSYGDMMYDCGNYFSSKELAEKTAKKISLMLRMQRWADEHNEPHKTGEPGVLWGVDFDKSKKTLGVYCDETHLRPFEVRFSNSSIAEDAIEIFKDEILEVMKSGV